MRSYKYYLVFVTFYDLQEVNKVKLSDKKEGSRTSNIPIAARQ